MFSELSQQKYLALRTFRKSGEEVITPVWIASEGDELFVFTTGESGKVKRIRRNGTIALAPCTMRGKVTGVWLAATATVDDTDATLDHVTDLIASKYGLEYKLFTMFKSKESVKQGRVIVRMRLVK